MRICVVYDCLYPHTIGGAQRWYRSLAERLAERGHEVTYLTLRQWPKGEGAAVPGVDVRAVGPSMELYAGGRRRRLPPIVFGVGVLWHLLKRGNHYDVVHTGSMPYFSLLAALALRRARGYRLFVDWIEVWTRNYWREYVGGVVGEIGWRIQRLCASSPHRAFAFARLHAQRLAELGHAGEVTVLDGLYAGGVSPVRTEREPVVVFAGRHIPEKAVPSIVPAFAKAREQVPHLRCELYGDGPDRQKVLDLVAELGLDGAVSVPGFVAGDCVDVAIRRALCFVLPSRREGYGLVVIESAAAGTPTVVVAHPDNAAVELVEEGVNGVVAPSGEPEALAAAILFVHTAGEDLRRSTREWFERNATRLSIDTSVDRVEAAYAE
ncbi:MAG: glycosyltransferase [Actinobacteria bacterium]|nr:glycosyltransferase [Actinomycetota bacterium]